ncbi:hypothetical protein FB391_3708 [Microbacterium kyungheense]|uniref:Uncharacterized protein n=1 Tax=Microbacterium kyungheense TaxID=1263636 RepID=A0A543EAH9_9MICO|nr:hypothetical protein FB391_3708 [Microbacterium kyungheense]
MTDGHPPGLFGFMNGYGYQNGSPLTGLITSGPRTIVYTTHTIGNATIVQSDRHDSARRSGAKSTSARRKSGPTRCSTSFDHHTGSLPWGSSMPRSRVL